MPIKKKQPVFPENSPGVINQLLKTHGLLEKNGQFLKKIRRGEKTNPRKLALLVRKRALGIVSKQELLRKIRLELRAGAKTAKIIAQELEEKIIRRVNYTAPTASYQEKPRKVAAQEERPLFKEYREPARQSPLARKPPKKAPPPAAKTNGSQDTYREPIE